MEIHRLKAAPTPPFPSVSMHPCFDACMKAVRLPTLYITVAQSQTHFSNKLIEHTMSRNLSVATKLGAVGVN